MDSTIPRSGVHRNHDVAQSIDKAAHFRLDQNRSVGLLDDRGPRDHRCDGQPITVIDVRFMVFAMKPHFSLFDDRLLNRADRRRSQAFQIQPRSRADGGGAQ